MGMRSRSVSSDARLHLQPHFRGLDQGNLGGIASTAAEIAYISTLSTRGSCARRLPLNRQRLVQFSAVCKMQGSFRGPEQLSSARASTSCPANSHSLQAGRRQQRASRAAQPCIRAAATIEAGEDIREQAKHRGTQPTVGRMLASPHSPGRPNS